MRLFTLNRRMENEIYELKSNLKVKSFALKA